MNKSDLYLDVLNKSNIDGIKKIWSEALPDNLKNIIGDFSINSYLNKFFDNNKNLGIGLFQTQNIKGFVLYGNDDQIIRSIIIKNFLKILKSFLKDFFKLNTYNLLKYFDVLIFMIFSKKVEFEIKKKNCELLIIAISKENQNKGLGSYLIKNSFKNYKSFFLNYEGVFVKTLKKTPENIQFYKKNNFIILKEAMRRVYLNYKI